jgi:hypothetical protein
MAGAGAPSRDPIFILGRPRSGSTLIEQILASHPAIEGTAELPYVGALAEGLGSSDDPAAVDALAALEPAALTALGEEYLHRRACIATRNGRSSSTRSRSTRPTSASSR